MVAVLPFENLGSGEDEYFADGITEEITARLAGLHGLGVISRTSTMQKEIQQAGDEGFEYLGQTVFESSFGGREVCVILQRDLQKPVRRYLYRLLATSRTSTMQKELRQMGDDGFEFLGMTVGKTALGGNEVVCFLRKVVE